MNAKELYELSRKNSPEVSYDLNSLCDGNNTFFDLIEYYWYDLKQNRVGIRDIKYHCYDGRRIWHLGAVFLDDVPFMIVQRAGREGDDFQKKFITNSVMYGVACDYLNKLLLKDVNCTDQLDSEIDIPELTSFYNQSLGQPFILWG